MFMGRAIVKNVVACIPCSFYQCLNHIMRRGEGMDKQNLVFQYRRYFDESSATLLLVLLLCTDLAFYAIQFLAPFFPSLNNNLMLDITKDGGYPEAFQYLKWFWITILMMYVLIRNRSLSYGAWVFIFTYLLCDDAFKIHENGGHLAAKYLSFIPPLGLRLQDIGELTTTAVACSILLPLFAWAYAYGSQIFKQLSHDLLILLLALAFFGIVADLALTALHPYLNWKGVLFFKVFEDGGEMSVASLILWYVFRHAIRDENDSSHLFDLIRTDRRASNGM